VVFKRAAGEHLGVSFEQEDYLMLVHHRAHSIPCGTTSPSCSTSQSTKHAASPSRTSGTSTPSSRARPASTPADHVTQAGALLGTPAYIARAGSTPTRGRPQRSVQLLRGAVRGALRLATVPGRAPDRIGDGDSRGADPAAPGAHATPVRRRQVEADAPNATRVTRTARIGTRRDEVLARPSSSSRWRVEAVLGLLPCVVS
jgi:hypothetical protein